MKRKYTKPTFEIYSVTVETVLGNVSGESDGEWSKGTGGDGGGASSMWEYMEEEDE